MRICFILNHYPSKKEPIDAFIRPVVSELSKQGNECVVIAPQSIVNIWMKKSENRPKIWRDNFSDGSFAIIYQPLYLSMSNIKVFGQSLSFLFQDIATRRIIRKEKIKPDVFYGHFWTRGVAAGLIKVNDNVPVVVVSGESKVDVYDKYPKRIINQAKEKIKGAIFVSKKNKDESLELELLNEDVYNKIIPNGYNRKDFYKINRFEARKSLNISNNEKIAIFVGTFGYRKGIDRVISAAKNIPFLKLILIGDGNPPEDTKQIIFKGRVPHSELVTYLNAADFFVLPTLAEGCCNAIVEALACGLPIISSNLSFNDDILDNTCSIRIDPLDVTALEKAMKKLTEESILREKLSLGALEKAKSLSIDERVKKIQSFLTDVVKKS